MNESNKNRGWIKLYRSVQDNPLWNEKPFDKARAWIDLLLMANHEERNVGFNGKSIKVNAGSFITSLTKLSDRWGWDRATVRRYLNRLQNEQMITHQVNIKCTVVSVVNWRLYQDVRTADEQQMNSKCTANEQQPHTNKKKEKRTKNSLSETDKKNKFCDFPQRQIDDDKILELERKKLKAGG